MRDDSSNDARDGPLARARSPPGLRISGGPPPTRRSSRAGSPSTTSSHRSDRPFEEVQPTLDELRPRLSGPGRKLAATRSPIASRASFTSATDAGLDAYLALHALTSSLAGEDPISRSILHGTRRRLRNRSSRPGRHHRSQAQDESATIARPARIAGEGHRRVDPAILVLNPTRRDPASRSSCPTPRPTSVPKGRSAAAQFTEDGVWAVVDLPPFGFSWVPRDANPTSPLGRADASVVSIRDRTLTNEAMTLAIDPATGGLRGLQAFGEETARIGQQLIVSSGLVGPDGKPAPSKMKALTFSAEYGGPALVAGHHDRHDPRPEGRPRLASTFRQRFRLWTGRPTLEIDIELTDLDPAWLASIAGQSDPWTHYLAVPLGLARPANDPQEDRISSPRLRPRRNGLESPDAIDLTSRQRRTTLLFGGLAHHKRHGQRMLDTLLVAGSETARTFQRSAWRSTSNTSFSAAVLDFTAPALVVPTETGPPRSGPTGWLLQVDHKSVAIARTRIHQQSRRAARASASIADLIETVRQGRPLQASGLLKIPPRARQVDGHGEHLSELVIEGDSALVDLTPHEIARVELTLGQPPNSFDD